MSKFTTALVVSPLSDGNSWVLLEEFPYHVGAEGSDDVVIASKGFVTDFASVPRLFWLVIPRWGKYGNAAVIHDWLYWDQGESRAKSGGGDAGIEGVERGSREEADKIFLEAMTVLNVGKWKKNAIYHAVRLFGGIAWKRNQIDKYNRNVRIVNTEEIKATMASKRPSTINSAVTYIMKTRDNKADPAESENRSD